MSAAIAPLQTWTKPGTLLRRIATEITEHPALLDLSTPRLIADAATRYECSTSTARNAVELARAAHAVSSQRVAPAPMNPLPSRPRAFSPGVAR